MKTVFFCYMDYMPDINTKRDMRCCEFTYLTVEGASRLQVVSASLAIISYIAYSKVTEKSKSVVH